MALRACRSSEKTIAPPPAERCAGREALIVSCRFGHGAVMTSWYFWDGAEQLGPMDEGELDRRLREHANPNLIRVWREGFAGWQTLEEAGLTIARAHVPPPLPPPLPQQPTSQNFIAQHWRGE